MASIMQTSDMSPVRVMLIGIAGAILIYGVTSLLNGRRAVPKGSKALPGPKGEESILYLPLRLSKEGKATSFPSLPFNEASIQ